ncbi:hypothetical protein VVD49_08355 [Uliginosibacterium sp. H3]|uniref:Uncharacterized protein n=1 Tax=Uliginosibacterium silvisoli TaxID=3114758 RepID=A0ABU6K2R6_9RHOO|nr:hypothetical protein [Uliginosibacterium sp. H3]
MKNILALLSLLFSPLSATTANASEDLGWAVLSGFESWHSDNRDDLNPHNTGIGVRAPGGWTLGTYYNSIRRWSVYAGKEWQWKLFGTDDRALRIGGVAGAVSGYKGGIKALLLPELMMVWKPVELGIIVIPRYSKDPVTVAAQLRYTF